jgi:hypothetical protein
LQAALPEPSPRALAYVRRQESRSERDKTAKEVAWVGLQLGLWGILLAVPYLIIRLLRRLWRFADSAAEPRPR